jgi:hypothetical protein
MKCNAVGVYLNTAVPRAEIGAGTENCTAQTVISNPERFCRELVVRKQATEFVSFCREERTTLVYGGD